MAGVIVKFGADLGELAGQLNEGRHDFQTFSDSARSAGESTKSSLAQIMDEAAEAATELGVMALAVHGFTESFDFEAAGRALKTGNFAALGGLFADAGKNMAAMAAEAVVSQAILLGLGGMAVAAAAGFTVLALSVEKSNKQIIAVAGVEAFAGNLSKIEAGSTEAGEATARFITELGKIPGVSSDQAAAIQAQLGSIHNYSTALEQLTIDVLPAYAAAAGQSVPDAMHRLASVLDQPLEKIKQFTVSLPNATAAEIAQAEAAARSGDQNRALATVMAILTGRYQQSGTQLAGMTSKYRTWSEVISEAGAAEGGLDTHLADTNQKFEEQTAKLQQNEAAWRKRIAALAAQPQTPEQRSAVADRVIDQANPLTQQVADAETKIRELKAHLADLQTSNGTQFGDQWTSEVNKTSDAITQLSTKLLQLKAQQAGGAPSALADLSAARQSLALGEDALRDARAKAQAAAEEVAQLKAALPANAQTVDLTQKEEAAARATLAVRMQELDLAKSKNALTKVKSDGSDAAGALAQAQANRAAEARIYAAGSQQMIDADAAVLTAKKAVDAESEQDQADKENQAFQNAQNKSAARIALIKQEGSEGQISHSQELVQLVASLDQQLAAEKAHYEKLKSIWDDGTTQYRAAVNQLAQVDTAAAQKRLEVTKQVDKEISDDYKKAFEKIGNEVSSSIMGMLQGQETLRQAGQKVLIGIVSDFVSAGVKMVADNASKVAMQVAQTVLGQTQQTAAVVAGNTARAAANSSGAAASVAANAVSAVQTLAQDASKVFGGVFAFLAPEMGPAAAPVAAASAATVLGGIYADGAWQLPQDQLALVHQGEMIVPAAKTSWAQDLMANASGGGGSGGGVHHHYHAHVATTVNHPVDGKQVMDHVTANAHKLLRSLSRAAGSSGLRPRGA